MTPEQIIAKAEELRKEDIGMSNYKQIVNDTIVLIRHLAELVAALEKK
jgi:hypothetical protein